MHVKGNLSLAPPGGATLTRNGIMGHEGCKKNNKLEFICLLSSRLVLGKVSRFKLKTIKSQFSTWSLCCSLEAFTPRSWFVCILLKDEYASPQQWKVKPMDFVTIELRSEVVVQTCKRQHGIPSLSLDRTEGLATTRYG